jgi:hypothetical protein
MASDEKITKLILQLTKATVNKEIKWKNSRIPLSLFVGNDDVIPFFLSVEYKGTNIALYEKRYKDYNPEENSTYWTGNDALAILGSGGEVLWEYRENSSALSNLITVAKESAANIDAILDSLIG